MGSILKLDEALDKNKYFNDLYLYFCEGSNFFGYNVDISKSDFVRIISLVYEVLVTKIGKKSTCEVVDGYVSLMVADARDGETVDFNWLISHVWYLNMNIPKNVSGTLYSNAILCVQQVLLDELGFNKKVYFKSIV